MSVVWQGEVLQWVWCDSVRYLMGLVWLDEVFDGYGVAG